MATVVEAVLVERLAQEADEAVHHPRRRDHVGAGARVRQRDAAEVLQRGVVVDLAVDDHAAVAVRGVLAEAGVDGDASARATAFLMARMARCTRPSAFQASVPTASFFSGTPNRITAGMPSFAISSASRASLSTENWNWPGSDEISLLHAFARADEQRKDEVVGRERGLAHHAAERRGCGAAGAGGIRGRTSRKPSRI